MSEKVCPASNQPTGDVIIFLGLIGLSMMEYGAVKPGNAPHLLLKNFIQFSYAIVFYWFLGFGFSFRVDSNNFIGSKSFGGENWLNEPSAGNGECFSFYVLMGTFMLFIVNLALVERTTYAYYIAFPVLLMIFCWPAVVAWVYGKGWLDVSMADHITDLGADIVVYVFAGAFALVSCLIVGRRSYRYSSLGNTIYNPALYILGCFLTILGVFGITVAQQPVGNWQAIYSAMHNQWISAACCGITSLKLVTIWHKDLGSHYISLYQGFIAGMILIASSSSNTSPWESGIIGVLGGGVFALFYFINRHLRLDDGLDVVACFFIPGVIGGILPGFLDHKDGVFWSGWESGQLLGKQTVGTFVVMFWSAFWGWILAGLFRIFKVIRLSDEIISGTLTETVITARGYTTDRKLGS